jgi:hypothetical protein
MDITNMLSELRSECQQIEEAILVLQRLAISGGGKRRGRPPKSMATAQTPTAISTDGKKRTFSLATRKKMAAAQRRRWAQRKVKAA